MKKIYSFIALVVSFCSSAHDTFQHDFSKIMDGRFDEIMANKDKLRTATLRDFKMGYIAKLSESKKTEQTLQQLIKKHSVTGAIIDTAEYCKKEMCIVAIMMHDNENVLINL